MLLKDLALGVVANGAGLDEAAQVELLRPEHGHGGQRCLHDAGERPNRYFRLVSSVCR